VASKLLKALFGVKVATKPPESLRKQVSQPNRQVVITNPWHAVSVIPCARSCLAARNLSTRRYLSAEAPPLPLAVCDLGNCTCSYRHHRDRRGSTRRAADVALSRIDWPGRERRDARGRRFTDQ
jgi:hypothetical protein